MSFSYVKDIIEFMYYVSGILLVLGVFIGIRQINLLKKDMEDRSRRASIEKSVEYLQHYATRILPAISNYRKQFEQVVPSPVDTKHLFDGTFNKPLDTLDKQVVVELIIKQDSGLSQILNELECFSAAIIGRLAFDEVVFTPVANAHCNFIKEEHLLISVLRNRGTPYRNIVELYHKWNDRLEVEKYELQKQEAEHKIKQKGHAYKSEPPIGL